MKTWNWRCYSRTFKILCLKKKWNWYAIWNKLVWLFKWTNLHASNNSFVFSAFFFFFFMLSNFHHFCLSTLIFGIAKMSPLSLQSFLCWLMAINVTSLSYCLPLVMVWLSPFQVFFLIFFFYLPMFIELLYYQPLILPCSLCAQIYFLPLICSFIGAILMNENHKNAKTSLCTMWSYSHIYAIQNTSLRF